MLDRFIYNDVNKRGFKDATRTSHKRQITNAAKIFASGVFFRHYGSTFYSDDYILTMLQALETFVNTDILLPIECPKWRSDFRR